MEIDRLSDLPECILLHIFSLLDATFIAFAPTLSKRFSSLDYSQIYSISFSYDTYWARPGILQIAQLVADGATDIDIPSLKIERFTNFIAKFFARRLNPTFSLRNFSFYGGPCSMKRPKELLFLISKGVEKAEEVDLAIPFLGRLSDCIYTNSRLKVFKLHSGDINILSNKQAFKSLKELHLTEFKFSHFGFDGMIFKKFDNLEILVLKNCYVHGNINKLEISAPNLVKLEISYFYKSWYRSQSSVIKIVISTPKLASFTYIDVPFWNWITFSKGLSQVTTYLDLFERKKDRYNDRIYMIVNVLHIIQSFGESKALWICDTTKQFISLLPGVDFSDETIKSETNIRNPTGWLMLSSRIQKTLYDLIKYPQGLYDPDLYYHVTEVFKDFNLI